MPFLYIFFGCKKPHSSKVFTQLHDRINKNLTVSELIMNLKKINALLTSIYDHSPNKVELLKKANKIYRSHILVNLKSDEDYSLKSPNEKCISQVFDLIGEYEI